MMMTLDEAWERFEGPSEETVAECRRAVWARYPAARWQIEDRFGRIVDGETLISLKFPLADPYAESMAWVDAAQRLGTGNAWEAHSGRPIEPS